MTFSPDKLYAAAEKAVKLLCQQSKHPGDEFDRAAMELANEADKMRAAIRARGQTT